MSDLKYVDGLGEVQRKLAEFPAKVEANVVRAALRAGATVIRREAQANVPVKSGLLKGTLRVSTFKRGAELHATVKAGDVKKRVFYAHLVEGGTKAHEIKARKGGILILGRRFFVKRVKHPGAQAKPFMAPALAAGAGRALEAIADKARERLEKLWK